MKTADEINRLIASIETELAKLDSRRSKLLAQVAELQREKAALFQPSAPTDLKDSATVTNQSTQNEKIVLFRSLFRGRDDIYPRRFESQKTGKQGYQPVCRSEWVRGICKKPKIRCEDCGQREFLPVTDLVIRNHLQGFDPQDRAGRNFTIGVYPMLPEETCWFLAADFDKAFWQEDVRAFLETCLLFNVPAVVERSRSGNGGMFGYSLLNPSQPHWRVRWAPSCFHKRWSAGQRSAWILMIGSSPARTRFPKAALGT